MTARSGESMRPLILPLNLSSSSSSSSPTASSSSSSSRPFSPSAVTLLPSPRPPPRSVSTLMTYTLAAVAITTFILYYARNLFSFLEYVKSLGLLGNLIIIASYLPTGLPFAFMSYYIPLTLSSGFIYGYYLGIATAMIGSVLSAWLGFWITRRFCRSWVEQRINSSRRLAPIKTILEGHAFKITFLMRFLPLPFGFQNGLCAMTNIPTPMFIFASSIGLLPENILLIYFGYSFDSIGELARGNFGDVSIYQKILFVSALIAGIALLIFGRKFITTLDSTGYTEVPNREEFLNVSLNDMEEGRGGGEEMANISHHHHGNGDGDESLGQEEQDAKEITEEEDNSSEEEEEDSEVRTDEESDMMPVEVSPRILSPTSTSTLTRARSRSPSSRSTSPLSPSRSTAPLSPSHTRTSSSSSSSSSLPSSPSHTRKSATTPTTPTTSTFTLLDGDNSQHNEIYHPPLVSMSSSSKLMLAYLGQMSSPSLFAKSQKIL